MAAPSVNGNDSENSSVQFLGFVKRLRQSNRETSVVCYEKRGLIALPTTAFTDLSWIQILDLEGNSLTTLPPQFSSLVNLVNLKLKDNRISSFPNDLEFSRLEGLCHLNLKNNLLQSLPSGFKLPQLRTLKLSHNRLSSIDPLCSITTLEVLNLSSNQLSELNPNISKLSSLQTLNLSANLLVELPESIGSLSRLTRLYLQQNNIDFLPSTAGNLTHLIEIDVSNNNLEEIPEEMIQITTLQKLSIATNVLYKYSNSFPALRMVNLKELSLSHSHIPDVTSEIANLTNLEVLNLDSNYLTGLPPELSKCISLVRLSLANNQIRLIPPELNTLTRLQVLNLANNKLEWLPYQLGVLQLKILDLVGNPLSTIPPEIRDKGVAMVLSYLKELGGSKTPWNRLKIVFVGQEFVGKTSLIRCFTTAVTVKKDGFKKAYGSAAIKRAHTGDTLATDGIDIAEWQPIVRVKGNKVVSVSNIITADGPPKSLGKEKPSGAPLKKRLSFKGGDKITHGPVSTSSSSSSTSPSLGTGSTGGEEEDLRIKFSAWDFAGQEVYYPTHQFFLSPRSIYLVVFNMVDEHGSRVGYWLNMIWSRSAHPVVILVGTHLDDKRCTKAYIDQLTASLEERYIKKFPFIKAIRFVSCRDFIGIEELRETLINFALKEKVLSQMVPSSYLMLTQVIEKERTKTPIMGYSIFEKMAVNAGVSVDNVKYAAEFLNDAGLIIHLDDKELRDYVFLSPQYLANVMASVITLKHQFVRDGTLKHSNLFHVWATYPQSNYPLLLNVLQKFQIMYPLTSSQLDSDADELEKLYLIPSMLPTEQPAGVIEAWPAFWEGARTISRVYQFKFLPLGFFSRLMTRILHHEGIRALFYWSSGLLLQVDDAKALIRYSSSNYKLTLTLRLPSRRIAPLCLRVLIENIETLAQGWYEANMKISIVCSHCLASKELSYDPFLFSLIECTEAVQNGTGMVYCRGVRPVRVDFIAPDLSFQDFPGRKIPYSNIIMSKELGKGAFGTVFLGILDSTEVAVKVMNEKASESVDAVEDSAAVQSAAFAEFQREVFIMSCLNHPNLVNLIGICLKPLAMVMECLPLGTLYHTLSNPEIPLSDKFRLKIAHDVAKGMDYLHSVTPSVIHRDLRSPNILLKSFKEEERVVAKVADFGLARFLAPTMFGGDFNPNWVAPEVIRGEEYNTKADVYGFGIICWELLTRQKPFAEFDDQWRNIFEFKENIVSGLRPTIPKEREEEIPQLCQLMRDCWKDDPNLRPTFAETVMRLSEMTGDYSYFPVERASVEILKLSKQNVSNSSDLVIDSSKSPRLSKLAVFKSRLVPKLNGAILIMTLVNDTVWTGCGDGSIWIWDKSGKFLRTLSVHQKRVYGLALMKDARRVCSAGDDETLIMWDVKTYKPLKKKQVHGQSVKVAKAFQRGSKSLLWTGGGDGVARIWTKSLKLKREIKVGDPITGMVQFDSRIYLATVKGIHAFDHETFASQGACQAHSGMINDIITTSDQIWTCSNDRTIQVWDKEGELIKTLEGHNSKVHVLLHAGDFVWSGSWDKSIMLWDHRSLTFVQELETVHTDAVRALVQVDKDTVWSGAASGDSTICSWSYLDGN